MPMKLCVIGNSHIAALKLGWDQVLAEAGEEQSRFAPTFFGAPRDGIRHVKLENGCLVARRKDITDYFRLISGGQDQIRLADYDAFLLVGLNVSSKRILRFYKTHAWVGLGGVAGKVMVHPAFARAFLAERYAETRMVELAGTIQAAANRPVVAVAEPHWASWARSAAEVPDYGWRAAILAGDSAAIGQAFGRAVAEALAPHARFVPQPDETVEDGIMTRAEFNKDASRLITGEGGGTDASHMNGAYGRAVWSAVARALPA
jgi:hypothetical protein